MYIVTSVSECIGLKSSVSGGLSTKEPETISHYLQYIKYNSTYYTVHIQTTMYVYHLLLVYVESDL